MKVFRISVEVELPEDVYHQARVIGVIDPHAKTFEDALKQGLLDCVVTFEHGMVTPRAPEKAVAAAKPKQQKIAAVA